MALDLVSVAAGLAVAGLIGLAVGIEREWSGHASGPGARFAGARTFFLLGLVGGVAGALAGAGFVPLAATLLFGAAALSVAAYALVARRGAPEAVDGTTEAAALAVLALGLLAGLGQLRLAAAAGAVVVLVLREKSAIHGFVRRLGEVELRAALQFAVLALVLLPILPKGPYGRLGGVEPRGLWLVVLIVSGLNFAGYLARKIIGDTHGIALAGILGGAVSSTAVSLTFSRQSREEAGHRTALAFGVVGACTALLLRLMVLTAMLRPALTPSLVPLLAPPFFIGLLFVWLGMRRRGAEHDGHTSLSERSPLRLGSAILLAVGFQAVLTVMAIVRDRFGDVGILASAALLGLTDMDALTYSMSRLAGEPSVVPLAALAIGIGVLANTCLKLTLVVGVGAGEFRRKAGVGLLLMAAGSGLGLWLAVGG